MVIRGIDLTTIFVTFLVGAYAICCGIESINSSKNNIKNDKAIKNYKEDKKKRSKDNK